MGDNIFWKKINYNNPPKDLVIARAKNQRPYAGYIVCEGDLILLVEEDQTTHEVTHYIDMKVLEKLPAE